MNRIFDTKIMKFVVFIAMFTVFSAADPGYAYQLEGCSADCLACHELEKKEAVEILEKFDARVIEVVKSPIKGLWMVQVEQRGDKFPIYIHYSKKYVFTGDIIDVETKKKVTEETVYKRNAGKQRVDFNSIPLEDTPVLGSKSAKNKVIVFTDPDCPYCRKLHKEMKKVVAKRKDIAFYLKLFPLPMHRNAYAKSRAILCEKSLKLLDDAFTGKKIPSPGCDTKAVDENIELAKSMGIGSTPTIIFKDNNMILGSRQADFLIQLIDKADEK